MLGVRWLLASHAMWKSPLDQWRPNFEWSPSSRAARAWPPTNQARLHHRACCLSSIEPSQLRENKKGLTIDGAKEQRLTKAPFDRYKRDQVRSAHHMSGLARALNATAEPAAGFSGIFECQSKLDADRGTLRTMFRDTRGPVQFPRSSYP